MKKNMGSLDKIIRIVLALIIGLLVYFEVIGGTLSYILLGVSAIFVLTSLVSFCPLYGVFGLNSCKTKQH